MSVQSKLNTALTLAPGQWAVFLEAVIVLVLAGLAIRLIPFKRYIQRIGTPLHVTQPDTSVPSQVDLSDHQMQQVITVAREVSRAAKNLPWHPVCLPQAIAAKRMLNRRHIPSTLYLGVATGNALEEIRNSTSDFESQDGMAAHAWLKAGDRFVTGRPGHEHFTIVSCFR